MPQPTVKVGKPLDEYIDRFDSYSVDGINVYISKYLDILEETIEIGYVKTLFKEILTVTGVA